MLTCLPSYKFLSYPWTISKQLLFTHSVKFLSPQAFIQSRTDKKLSPSSVKVYSTLGGTSQ